MSRPERSQMRSFGTIISLRTFICSLSDECNMSHGHNHFYSIMKQIGQVEASFLILVREAERRCTFSRPGAPLHLYLLLKSVQLSCSFREGTVPSLWWNSKLNKGYIIKCCPWTRGRAANWPTNRRQVFRVGLRIETGNQSVFVDNQWL